MLEDGDIVNVDVTVYYKGVHGENYVPQELLNGDLTSAHRVSMLTAA